MSESEILVERGKSVQKNKGRHETDSHGGCYEVGTLQEEGRAPDLDAPPRIHGILPRDRLETRDSEGATPCLVLPP